MQLLEAQVSNSDQDTTRPVRGSERISFDGAVSIRVDGEAIVGSGQNVSEQGVFFVSKSPIKVSVEIAGRDTVMSGELVRIENMGAGDIGIAVKFDETHSDLIDGGS